jgi:hypothetical protein
MYHKNAIISLIRLWLVGISDSSLLEHLVFITIDNGICHIVVLKVIYSQMLIL